MYKICTFKPSVFIKRLFVRSFMEQNNFTTFTLCSLLNACRGFPFPSRCSQLFSNRQLTIDAAQSIANNYKYSVSQEARLVVYMLTSKVYKLNKINVTDKTWQIFLGISMCLQKYCCQKIVNN